VREWKDGKKVKMREDEGVLVLGHCSSVNSRLDNSYRAPCL